MNRRTFFKGLAATAAGVLIPEQVLAEPERRIWALDRTMVPLGRGKKESMTFWDDLPGSIIVVDWYENKLRTSLYSNKITNGDWTKDNPGVYRFDFADAQHVNPSDPFRIDNTYYEARYISGNTVFATKWGQILD